MRIIKKTTQIITLTIILQIISRAQALAACEYDYRGTTYEGIETGLGCIPTSPTGLVEFFVDFAFLTTGGIAMLLLMYGGFQVITSSGDPKAINDGKETITSALSGLGLVLFSVAILRIIGYNVLGIPFFGP